VSHRCANEGASACSARGWSSAAGATSGITRSQNSGPSLDDEHAAIATAMSRSPWCMRAAHDVSERPVRTTSVVTDTSPSVGAAA